jgi:chromosome segregation ATPase
MSDGLGDLKPEDIPKEELLHLCMKMNKRMQAMETKGKELLKKKNTLQNERQKLLTLIETTLNHSFHVSNDQELDVNLVEKTWNDWDTNNIVKIKDYERQLQNLSSKSRDGQTEQPSQESASESDLKPETAISDSGASSFQVTKLETELAKLKNQDHQLKESLKTIESKLNEKINENEKLNKDLEVMKTTYEEKILFVQMNLQQQKQSEYVIMKTDYEKLQRKLEEKDILLSTNKEMLVALQARLMEVEPELSSSKNKTGDLEKKLSSLQLMKFESDNLINSLKTDLKSLSIEKEKLLLKTKEIEENKFKSDSMNQKIMVLSDEMNNLKEENDEKSSLIIRLRSEISTNEKNHAVRVAMLAASEATNEELLKKLENKDFEMKDLIDKISNLQINYSTLEESFKSKTFELNHRNSLLENQLVQEKENSEKALKSLKVSQEETLENMKRDLTKKSAMARSLLSEREEEVRVLSHKVHELQEEIKSGAPSDRKIFELAQVQSKRDTMHGIHR